MSWDQDGLTVAATAAFFLVVLSGLYAIAPTRAAVVLGVRRDAPLLLNPTGLRLQALLLGYGAALVAVGALVFSAVRPMTEGASLAWTLSWTSGALVLAGTVMRVARHAALVLGGRTAVVAAVAPGDVLPVDEIGDDIDLRHALAAARTGNWRPAAALLRATADDDVRADRVGVLAEQSVHDSQWVEDWFAAEPGDPDAAVVRAALAMHRAWSARGAAAAERTTTDQFDAFLTGLAQAERLAERAVELAPADPTAWWILVEIARGQQVDPEEFQRRLDGLRALAPAHVHGGQAALQTLCAKWLGGQEVMFQAARDLAADAPEGSASCLLPVQAHVEHYLELAGGPGGTTRAARHMESGATRTELRVCVQRWLSGPDGAPAPGGRLYGHNLAAYAFWLAEDAESALPHLHAVGRSVTAVPWCYSGEPGEVLAVVRRWAGLPVVAALESPPDPAADVEPATSR